MHFRNRRLSTTSSVLQVGSGAVAYTGPGDVVGSALAFWGLRAYTSASIGGNVVKLRESGGNTTQIFTSQAGGGLDLSAISTFKGANNLFVDTLYDQTGNGHNLVQATTANQPAFILSGLGSLPVLTFNGSTQQLATAASFVYSQPFTHNFVTDCTSNSSRCGVIGDDGAAIFTGFAGSAHQSVLFYGGLFTATASDNTWHSIFGSADATTAGILTTDTTDTPGTSNNGGTSGKAVLGGRTIGTEFYTGKLAEAVIWGSQLSGTNRTNIYSNQHTYWGY